jgi:hypothetical protein
MASTAAKQLWLPFSKEEMMTSKTLINSVDKSLPFLQILTEKDVKSTAKLDSNREAFIRDVILEMTNAEGKVPTLASLEKLICFYANFGSSYEVEDILKDLYDKARRNHIWYGDKAYSQASRFYFDLDKAIEDEVEGAEAIKKRLAIYFANKGNGNDNKTNGNTDKGSDNTDKPAAADDAPSK